MSNEYHKLQPQATELEDAVLGAVLIDKDAISIVSDIIRPGMFYKQESNAVYEAIISLYSKGRPIDILTVSEAMKAAGTLDRIGGSLYLVDITNKVASAANVEYHSRIIAQKHIRRQLISFGTQTITAAYDNTKDDLEPLELAEQSLFKIWSGMELRGASQIGKASIKALKMADEAMKSPGGIVGVPCGLRDVDALTGGWRNSDLIILAARPGMGKTSFAMNAAYEAAKQGKAIGVFSLEMSADQLATRMMCAACNVDSQRVRNGRCTDSDIKALAQAASDFQNLPIYIDDTPGMSIFQLRSAARRMKMRHNIGMVVVDYLQLMTGGGEKGKNREQEISDIARGLKTLAKELDVPVIALSQLSRAVESRGGTKRPMLSDLRESGAIEQDADIVSFIYRSEYYGFLEDEEGNSTKGVAEIIFAKHRSGPLDTVKVRWIPELTQFSNLEKSSSTFPHQTAASPSASMPVSFGRNEEAIPF